MSCNWPLVKVDDLKAKTKGSIAIGPFGSRMKSDCYVDEGIPVIRGTNITEGPDFKGKFVFITEEKADELGSCNVYQNDLVFPHRGSIGEVGIILGDQRYVLSSSLMKISCDTQKVNPQFLYYFFKSRLGRYELLKNASQVGTPGIGQPLTSLKGIELRLPPLSIQDKIAGTLSSLNQKIAMNDSTNQTLEKMAQAIFKSWFVDFDPVKAKMNGDQPEGMNAATASLFPEKLVESELGLIPEGWEVKAVGDFTNTFDYVANGSFAALKENVELFDEPDDVLYIRTTDFNKGFKNNLKYTNESSYQFLKKSKLYGHETIISNVGDVGTVFRAPTWYDMPMTLGSNAMGVVAESANSYIYYLFKSYSGQHFLDGITSGSAQMKFNKTSFRKLRVVLPSKGLLAKFEQLEASLWAKHASNQKESLHLERLRDTLLPKLLSGERLV